MAWNVVAPSARIAGVVMTAPPMPNMPDSTPLTKPTATVSDDLDAERQDGGGYSEPDRLRESPGPVRAPTATLSCMASDLDLHGVWIPLITPFDKSGAVDVEAIERLCGEYLADGVAGIVALGTTGESPALDADEKRAVIDACSRVCAERGAPLIVGTGTNNTRSTIAATQALEGIPARGRRARGRAVLHPSVGSRDRRALPRGRRGEPGADRRLQHSGAHRPRARRRVVARAGARSRNVAGVKQAVAALDVDTLEVLANAPAGFAVLSGDDYLAFPIVCMGGVGGITASAHVCTARFVAMVECGLAGKLEDGRHHAEALLPVVQTGVRRAEPGRVQGCAPRAGPDRHPRRAHAARPTPRPPRSTRASRRSSTRRS